MSTEEPPSKKAKPSDDWKDHTMNIGGAVMKADEGRHLTELSEEKVAVLQGIGPKADAVLEALKIKTIKGLASYKYFKVARAIKTLAETEETRPMGSVMNIDNILDKEYETKSLKELLEAPLSALEGLTEKADELLGSMGLKTIGDLATFKFCEWAEAITVLAEYEELKNKEERHLEKALKRLS